MKKTAIAVIGTNYGDEGKGLVTDSLCHEYDADIVVRFNGGAQAGHTVVTPEGVRHVFHHFGSGSLLEVPTFLSRRFIVNPMLFESELKELSPVCHPRVHVHPDCMVTTPYDMMINQLVETDRGTHRHGSCGSGINETVTRNERSMFKLKVADLWGSDDSLSDKLAYIQNIYVPNRLNEFGISLGAYPDWNRRFNSEEIHQWFIDLCHHFRENTFLRHSNFVGYRRFVFEGAQGLALDEFSKDFPYVTRSRTGTTNVVEAMDQLGIQSLEVNYVTRWYLTRHGAGPLPNEDTDSFRLTDLTNVTNDWQGPLRYAPLDVDHLNERIKADLKNCALPNGNLKSVNLFVTHLDDCDLMRLIYNGNEDWWVPRFHITDRLKEWTPVDRVFGVHGPTRTEVIYSEATL